MRASKDLNLSINTLVYSLRPRINTIAAFKFCRESMQL